jgi:hypothetical protein
MIGEEGDKMVKNYQALCKLAHTCNPSCSGKGDG